MTQSENFIGSNDINLVDTNGQTELSRACQDGHYQHVKNLLLNPAIDIYMEDNSGMSPLEYALKKNHFACAALITNEAFRRSINPDHPFLTTLRDYFNTCKNTSFSEEFFRQAVENDPQIAHKYLDQFVEINDTECKFQQLDQIFGLKIVRTSALASILNDCILQSQADKKLDCLQHVVLHRILDIKWELFGARKYYQQLLIYIVMLMAITNVVLSNLTQEKVTNATQGQKQNLTTGSTGNSTDEAVTSIENVWMENSFILWIFTIIFCLSGLIFLRLLEPLRFIKLTRWMYDGKYIFQPNFVIPEVNRYKIKTRKWLLKTVVISTIIVALPLLFIMKYYMPVHYMYQIILAHAYITPIVLWLCALYFLVMEMKELLGEDPWIYYKIDEASILGKVLWGFVMIFIFPFATPFMASYRKYFRSHTNKLQLLTYFIILVPFAYLHYLHIQRSISTFTAVSEEELDCLDLYSGSGNSGSGSFGSGSGNDYISFNGSGSFGSGSGNDYISFNGSGSFGSGSGNDYISFNGSGSIETFVAAAVPELFNIENTEPWNETLYLCLGAFCTISLWVLSLQFLEVNRSTGYLLPIVADVLWDVWDFLIFYGVFQCGLTCAYYFIFETFEKNPLYNTFWLSFCSTYFVMYGANGLENFVDDDGSIKLDIGLVLRMFQCAVMVVLLMNLLIAMMNKTVNRNWENIQSRALASYARAVLRIETMLGHTDVSRAELTQLKLSDGTSILNPIFSERISKLQLLKHDFAVDSKGDYPIALSKRVAELESRNIQLQKRVDDINATLQSEIDLILQELN